MEELVNQAFWMAVATGCAGGSLVLTTLPLTLALLLLSSEG